MTAWPYRVRYADVALASLKALPSETRRRFEADIRRLAADPYGLNSKALKEQDYREAVVGGCITVYYVSTTVEIVSVTRVQGPP
ncbi:type II toxin-antitoxin system RelE family toxin [Streptomyces jumonjinensis]|uniref:type II toxin-antitoxin system RelE family toxin n=1 Tax=Streptomyces jumonjinensis TaxID=1945 RepID=UPI001E45E3D1|nr:hypothetical protein [Streptomyces jumonjinensis]